MKIAFTSTGNGWDAKMDPRFGRAPYLMFWDDSSEELEVIDNSAISETAHGAGPQTAQKLISKNPDILITGNGPGGNAKRALEGKLKIMLFVGNLTVKEAYEQYKAGELKEF